MKPSDAQPEGGGEQELVRRQIDVSLDSPRCGEEGGCRMMLPTPVGIEVENDAFMTEERLHFEVC